MYKPLFLSLVLIIGLSLSAQMDISKTINTGGRERHYILHLPPVTDNHKPLPVIFALHGGGGTAAGAIGLYNFNGLADKYGFIIVYPDAIDKSWNMPGINSRQKNDTSVDDVQFISTLIDTVAIYYHGDPAHVFATGISRGGIFSLYLAKKLSSRIFAIAPVCASIPKYLAKYYHFKHPTPVMLINGTDDPLIKYDGGFGKFLDENKMNDGFDMMATEDLVKRIAFLDSCKTTPEAEEMTDKCKWDNCTALVFNYNCGIAPLIFIKVLNGGHTWPGGKQYLPKFFVGNVCRDFKAENEIMNFFLKTMSRD
jgi:polyhydroxybutyrate depolymerase